MRVPAGNVDRLAIELLFSVGYGASGGGVRYSCTEDSEYLFIV